MAPPFVRTALAAALAALAAAAVMWPGTSSASHQTPKNGCTSADRVSGSLTSPSFSFGSLNQVAMDFRTWWEIEGRRSASSDRMIVLVSIDGGAIWTPVLTLNPGSSPGSSADVPLSNTGLQVRPDWQQAGIELPDQGGQPDVRFRFSFDSVDASFNGFRGWGIDDVVVSDGFGSVVGSIDFDASPGLPAGWQATGFWRVQEDPQAVSIVPGINPQLVTLAAGDNGTLPAAFSGNRVAWFGEAATGTYCGTGSPAENFPPTASFSVSASAPRTSDVVTFDGSSSSDPDGPPASYTWNFGDGSPAATGPTASHVYRRAGTYTVALTVTDAQGAASTASAALGVVSNLPSGILVADSLDDLPNPTPFRNFNAEPTGGEVFVQLPRTSPGSAAAAQAPGAPPGFIPLTQAAQLPVGSILETSRGKVMLESARDRRGRRTQRAEFFEGRFRLRQPLVRRRALITELLLTGGSFRACPRARRSASWSRANDAQRRRRSSRVRRLWGNGRGRFRTRGRYSSATVRGTTWLVEDRCNGTLTRLPRRPRTSVVDVRDLVTRRTVRLRAGRRYLARPRAARR